MELGYLVTGNKAQCYGCRACEEICPKKCIKMTEDEETFLYPEIDKDKCIDCGLCKKVCPVNAEEAAESPISGQRAVAAVHKEEEVVYKSSSGGAFTAIVNAVYDENTVIFGVCYDEKLQVKHTYIDNLSELDKFRKSKYVQSNTNGAYSKVKELLQKGKKVIFSGTPCQNAALKTFLGKCNTENLLCIDLVCHGVPSQKLFDMYLSEQKKGIESFVFKNKDIYKDKVNSRTAAITYSDGRKRVVGINDDAFLKGYYTRLIYRPSCEVCKYASPQRVSDITIADAWGIQEKYSELNALKGCSLIVANTQKGNEIVAALEKEMKIYPVEMDWAVSSNEQMRKPTDFHPKRGVFFEILKTRSFENAVNYATRVPLLSRVLNKVKRFIGGK